MATNNDFDLTAERQRSALGADRRDDRQLIRCAALAASSHNTQPWQFRIGADAITIVPDLTRRCPVVDPDDAHLFKSLGCAAENLVQAASAQGLTADTRFDAERNVVVVDLRQSPSAEATELFEAIGRRQCTKRRFDGSPCTPEELAKLELAGSGDGVRAVVATDPQRLSSIADLVADGNQIQLTDRSFRRELLSWIRFSPTEALRTGDGLAGRCAGNPSLPRPVGKLLAPLVIRARSQSARDTAGIRSSAGVAVFVSANDDKPAWVEAGRAYQRFALQATALEIRTAFINQPIEVRALRPKLAALLGLDGEHVQLAVRFGRSELAPFSLRRPVDDVIDGAP